jgi:hypothetical protein
MLRRARRGSTLLIRKDLHSFNRRILKRKATPRPIIVVPANFVPFTGITLVYTLCWTTVPQQWTYVYTCLHTLPVTH